VLLKQAGILSPDRQRVLSFVNSVTSFIGALSGTALVDRLGRRKLMLFASVCCFCGMLIVAVLLSPAGKPSTARANAGISFIYLFMVFFSFGWTPIQALYPAEVFRYEVRAKGLAAQNLFTQSFSCINTFGLPPALAALEWKTYLIFACWDIVGIAVIWMWAVETRQIPLEDLDAIFDAKSPKQEAFKVIRARRLKDREAKEEEAQA
jgi:MFS family permease